MAKELVAMLLAGGQGSRLYALTQKLQSRQFRLEANTELLIFHFLIVLIQV